MLNGFTIQLTFPHLSLEDQYNDGPCAGLRCQNRVDQSTLQASPSTPEPPPTGVNPVDYLRDVSPGHHTATLNLSSMPIPVYNTEGPAPARRTQSYDEWLACSIPTVSVGRFRRVLGHITTGNPNEKLQTQTFSMELDLGSSEMWVYGTESRGIDGPKGAPGQPARFWAFKSNSTNRLHNSTEHSISYADGSAVSLKLYSDYFHLKSSPPPSGLEKNRDWLWMIFGVAHKVSESFEFSPASGILGLGREMKSPTLLAHDESVSFLQQLQTHLRSPEFVVTLAPTSGCITFGVRAIYDSPEHFGPWSNNIPVAGEAHWRVPSTRKLLNGKEYAYENGSVILDTGAAFCYMDPKFAKDLYDLIPGSFYDSRPKSSSSRPFGVYLIPLDVTQEIPTVQFDVGGALFTLEEFFLSREQTATLLFNGKYYVTGPIQSKENLYPERSRPYTGPDVMGRVALMSMELVCQFPQDQPHSISWRRKDRRVTGGALA
ncbi:aspartic peptidase domain-containing protein [Mycena metata]|uniref:Aspartic peptidase domain-containing protein n=1 Tax=Mycena metata TaxID=1033252 RepID=A0AAD7GRT2_9AGAR|nr:aspartic peptidase domain-containing protein [Mycena metata]